MVIVALMSASLTELPNLVALIKPIKSGTFCVGSPVPVVSLLPGPGKIAKPSPTLSLSKTKSW